MGFSQNSFEKEDFFLAAGRLVPYKRFDMVVEAMKQLPDQKLVVIGDGTEMGKIKSLAGDNVELLGFQSDEVLRDYMSRAKAFVFAAVEDFGIMPVEAQASGTPVIGLNKGGVAETVVHRETGILFENQNVNSLADAMQTLADLPQDFFDPERIRAHAATFSRDVFRKNLMDFVERSKEQWRANRELAQDAEHFIPDKSKPRSHEVEHV